MQSLLSVFHLAAACKTNNGFLPSLYDGIQCDANGPVLSSVSEIFKILGNIVRILIALSGSIAVVVIIVAAIYYITSTGDAGRVKKARDILINMAVGLIVILVAYAVVTFIAKGF